MKEKIDETVLSEDILKKHAYIFIKYKVVKCKYMALGSVYNGIETV